MNLEQFQLLPQASQFTWVMHHGTYLAHRWEGVNSISLFHLPLGGAGFYAEIGVSKKQDAFVLLRSFDSQELLDEYIVHVQLPYS